MPRKSTKTKKSI